jgi:hypothetical protein
MKCPDCGREVSDSAPACPQCARPMRTGPPPLVATTPEPLPSQPSVVVQTQSKSTRFVFGCLAAVIIGVVGFFLVGFIAAIAIPNFVKARQASQRAACIQNLRMIAAAKASWANDKGKKQMDEPGDDDIFSEIAYMREKPSCPANGIYSLNPVGNNPTCTIVGHTL